MGERVGRVANALGRLARSLAEGIPGSFVAALAALVLVATLYTVATREPKEPRGYSEFTMFAQGCAIDRRRSFNVAFCRKAGNGVYAVTFTKSLSRSTAVASRATCCPGRIGASIVDDRTVLVSIVRVRFPRAVRASLVVP
jgi:hypothetical protein